ncbi:MAG: hypothetical protein JKP92_05935 [Alphaproteobacteria bacterium]|jgi:hypothetical protein|nr:hypothetical protein [Alphaproteobacteria bacterium]
MIELSPDLIWWATAIEVPALAGLFALILRTRAEAAALREALAAFRLEAARTYAAQGDVHTTEARLAAHLWRIEAKLDKTALAAARLERG